VENSNQCADNIWTSVTYGNGLFVAVANSGTGNRVMTSPDGITWTIRTSAANNSWQSVTYGNGLFVAVSTDGSGNRVMTSSNGITWTIRTSAANNGWTSVTYGNGLFVAVANSGTGNRVMTSLMELLGQYERVQQTIIGAPLLMATRSSLQ
jgi:predicted RecA/RadA family phage recombinase